MVAQAPVDGHMHTTMGLQFNSVGHKVSKTKMRQKQNNTKEVGLFGTRWSEMGIWRGRQGGCAQNAI